MRTRTSNAFPGFELAPVMQRDEELELARAYRSSRDPKLARRLAEGHLRLVVFIARDCVSSSNTLGDLVQEGCIGLLKAIERFDPERGVRLATYASYWIRAYVLQMVMNDSRPIRIATTLEHRRLFFALQRELRRGAAQGREPVPAELATKLRVSVEAVTEMLTRLTAHRVGLTDQGDIPDHGDETPGPLEIALRRERSERVRQALATLDPLCERERAICQERLMADPPVTLQELGQRFGLCRERMRQIETRLMERLRAALQEPEPGPSGRQRSWAVAA